MLILMLPLILLSNAQAQVPEEERYGNTLRVAIAEPVPSLDIHKAIAAGIQSVTSNVVETLILKDFGGADVPGLARDWEISDDQLTYTLYLREGVKFHDGSDMTAEDVKASLDRWFAVTPVQWEVASFEEVEIVDDYTIRAHLSEPFTGTLDALGLNPAAILPKEIVDRVGEGELDGSDLIGTGIYKLADFTPERTWMLERFEDYHGQFTGELSFMAGERKGYADTIEITRVAEAGTRLAGLLAGDYDIADDLSPDDLDLVESRRGVNADVIPGALGWYTKFNSQEGPFANELLRQAVRVGIRPMEIMAGFGDERLWELNLFPRFHPESPYNLNDQVHAEYYYPEDMELARAMVEASGYNGEPIRVIGSRDLAGWYVQAIGILPMLQEMGLNAELIIVDRPQQLELTLDTSQWEIKTSYSTPIRRAAVLGFHGRHRDGTQWSWAGDEHLYYEGVLWRDLERRDEAITRMVEIELERAGQLWLGHTAMLRGYGDHVQDMPFSHYLNLYNTWIEGR
ncbi:MAG: ABC transporter substrate-binding protein [Trueperaceae bacterium]